ncbi:MAG: dihydrodipicolinate synthase family protein [Bacteroidota bacterium]
MEYYSNLPDGLFTAALTPMNDDLSVNYAALIKHINWLLNNGSNGICLLGTTGEANSFSVEERIEIISKVIKAGIDPKVLLVGTGTCALPDTIRLTKYAVSKGVGGILMLPPFYYKDLTDAGILNYFRMVIDGVDDSRLRIYLYHFPKMTGVSFTLELTKKLIDSHPGIIVGMKDSGGEWQRMQSIIEALPGFKLYTGTEKFLLNNLRHGGTGCISATFNASIKQGAEVYNNWQNEDADEYQKRLTETRTRFEVTSFISGLKYLFVNWFDDKNWLNMRPPNALPAKDIQEYLLRNLEKEDLI